jgi:hypothetical protein
MDTAVGLLGTRHGWCGATTALYTQSPAGRLGRAIDQAILLADTVYVMNARPRRIRSGNPVDLPRPLIIGRK